MKNTYPYALLVGCLLAVGHLSAQTREQSSENAHATQKAIPWTPIQWKDIAWAKTVRCTIDSREVGNEYFINNASVPDNDRLANILIRGIFEGKYDVYSPADDRFSMKLPREEVIASITGNANLSGNQPAKYFSPDEICKFKLKEDWLYVPKSKQLYVRIAGIAPVREVKDSNGKTTDEVLFWFYYPDVRDYLAQHDAYNPAKKSSYNWDQLFEDRKFSARIISVGNRLPDVKAAATNATEDAKLNAQLEHAYKQ